MRTITLLLALTTAAQACPFCSPGGGSSSPGQSVALADSVVLAKVVSRKLVFVGDQSAKPVTTFEVLKLGIGDAPPVGRRFSVTSPRGALGDATQAVLMLGLEDDKITLMDCYPDPAGKLLEYLVAAKALGKHDFAGRIAFFCSHLEHEILDIADDAQRQFMDIPYESLIKHKNLLPLDGLRKWLASEKVPAVKKGLYGLMLGTAGNAEDVDALRRAVEATAHNAIGSGGVLAGLCVLNGKPEAVLSPVLTDAKSKLELREGAVSVLRFLWEQKRDRELLSKLYRVALADRELAPTVLGDWRLMQEFSFTPDVQAYWLDPKRLTPKGRTAVFRYKDALPEPQRKEFKEWMDRATPR